MKSLEAATYFVLGGVLFLYCGGQKYRVYLYAAETQHGNLNGKKGDMFYYAGPHRNQCYHQPIQEKLRRGFGENAGERTRRVEISKEEIPGSRLSMHCYILAYSRL